MFGLWWFVLPRINYPQFRAQDRCLVVGSELLLEESCNRQGKQESLNPRKNIAPTKILLSCKIEESRKGVTMLLIVILPPCSSGLGCFLLQIACSMTIYPPRDPQYHCRCEVHHLRRSLLDETLVLVHLPQTWKSFRAQSQTHIVVDGIHPVGFGKGCLWIGQELNW